MCFFPSFEIIHIEISRIDHLPNDYSVLPGKLVVHENSNDLSNIQLNGTAVSEIDSSKYFFVAGLYGGNFKVIHGEETPTQSVLSGLLQSPKQRVYRNNIQITRAPLSSGNTLRLPAHVRQRLKTSDDDKKLRDRYKLITALNTNIHSNQFSCWKRPLKSKVTSDFARPRTLPSGRSYYHSGVDLRAATHTPIKAASEGTVVFAGHMLVPGNNVIINHGKGLFSRYMHLQSTKVSVGQKVEVGQVIGTAGATGRVEAPHLHWEVSWKGQHADPLMFVKDWKNICSETKVSNL